jgi:hypothetical protein
LEGQKQDLEQFYLDMKQDTIKLISKLQTSGILEQMIKKKILEKLLRISNQQSIKLQEMKDGQKEKVYEKFLV